MIDIFSTYIVPKTHDVNELKAMLYILYLIDAKGGAVTTIRYEELSSCIAGMDGMNEKELRHALEMAIDHGVLQRVSVESGEAFEPVPSLISRSNIFNLYEQNIGMITPMMADELKEAEKRYPGSWIDQAFREAVALNKRSWRYISRILERWASEGKESGTHRKDYKENGPDKYVRGKYGHLIKR
jgi:DnaD/phage-associated family protein